MRKLRNPWIGMKEYHCFGCCPDNPEGLKMEFFEEGDDIISYWHPQQHYEGWVGVLHGGVIATLLDEACGWVIFRKMQCSGFTTKLEVKYHKQISSIEPQITVRAHLQQMRHGLAFIEARIEDAAGDVCASAQATYFCQSPQKSIEMGFKKCEAEDEQLLSF